MRIAIVTATRAKLGGVETYLDAIVPVLLEAGHELAMLYEADAVPSRAEITLPPEVATWSIAGLGRTRALAALREWRADVLYVHPLVDSTLEGAILGSAPAVFFMHGYHGTCISGTKTFTVPRMTPCSRRFGWPCAVLYFPRRCGGRSPFTMLKLYRLQARRLRQLRRYDAIVTHSEHMLREYLKHGLPAERTYNFPYYVDQTLETSAAPASVEPAEPRGVRRLVFAGRMEVLKGGQVFLDALALLAERVPWEIDVVFAGEGRAREAWERKAAEVQRAHPRLSIAFRGWLQRPQMDVLLQECDLLVVPSLWPEPFGLVGPEAGVRGVPTVAFAVGGIPDWLIPGVNGHLAPGDPPTAEGLADAIVRCLRDPAVHARLRRGAVEVAKQFGIDNHVTALIAVFQRVIEHRR